VDLRSSDLDTGTLPPVEPKLYIYALHFNLDAAVVKRGRNGDAQGQDSCFGGLKFVWQLQEMCQFLWVLT
jgi:hypothetical protein